MDKIHAHSVQVIEVLPPEFGRKRRFEAEAQRAQPIKALCDVDLIGAVFSAADRNDAVIASGIRAPIPLDESFEFLPACFPIDRLCCAPGFSLRHYASIADSTLVEFAIGSRIRHPED